MTISSSKRAVIGKLLKKSRSGSRTVFHVIPQKGGWSVKGEGSERAQRILDTKREAIHHARTAVTGKYTRDIVVHNRDGAIASKISVGPHIDKREPKDSVRKTGRAKK